MNSFENILKKLNISFDGPHEANHTSSLTAAYAPFNNLWELSDLQPGVAEKLAAQIQLSLVSSDLDLNQNLIDKDIDITKLADTRACFKTCWKGCVFVREAHENTTFKTESSVDELLARVGLGLDIIKPIQHRAHVVSKAIKKKLEDFEVFSVQQECSDTSNQRTPPAQQWGMEADLLPNPGSDCNLDASLQSRGGADSHSIEQTASNRSAPSLANLLPSLIPSVTVNRPTGIYIDIIAPASASPIPIDGERTFTISGRATKVQKIFILPSGGYSKPVKFLIHASFLIDHAGQAFIKAFINQGANSSSITSALPDKELPELMVIASTDNQMISIPSQLNQVRIEVVVKVRDRLSGVAEVQASVDDWAHFQALELGNATSFDWTIARASFLLPSVSLKNYNLRVRAYDRANVRNDSIKQKISFQTVDQTGPEIQIESPQNGATLPYGVPVDVIGWARDTQTGLASTFTWRLGAGGIIEEDASRWATAPPEEKQFWCIDVQKSSNLLQPGSHTLDLCFKDRVGNA